MLQGNFYQVEVILDVLPQLSYIHQLKIMPGPVKRMYAHHVKEKEKKKPSWALNE